MRLRQSTIRAAARFSRTVLLTLAIGATTFQGGLAAAVNDLDCDPDFSVVRRRCPDCVANRPQAGCPGPVLD